MDKENKRKLLKIIQSNIYFGELSEEEVNKAVKKGLSDKAEDELEAVPHPPLLIG